MKKISLGFCGDCFALRKVPFLFLFLFVIFCLSSTAQGICEASSSSQFKSHPKKAPDSNESDQKTVREFYEDGSVKAEVETKNGVRQGLAHSYYPDGKVKASVNYVDNQIDGLVKKYYQNGSLYKESLYVKGKKSGPTRIYDPEGNLFVVYEYKDGNIVHETYFYEHKANESASASEAVIEAKENPTDTVVLTAQTSNPNLSDQEIQTDNTRKEDPIREEKVERELNFWEKFLSHIDWELGYDQSSLIYKSDQKRDESKLSGVDLSLKYTEKDGEFNSWVDFFKFDFRYMYGKSEQRGTRFFNSIINETLEDVPIYFNESKLYVGKNFTEENFPILGTSELSLSTGLGYRYLSENPGDQSSSAYRRESNYVFLPLNAEFKVPVKEWTLSSNFELDGILGGWDVSHFSDLGTITTGMTVGGTTYTRTGVVDDATNTVGGYGISGSLKVERKSKWIDFIAEPFFNFWSITGSKEKHISVDGVEFKETVGGADYFAIYNLPENTSTEYGLKLRLKY